MRVLHVAQTLPGGIASYLDEVIPYQAAELGAANVRLLASGAEFDQLSPATAAVATSYGAQGRSPGSLWKLHCATSALVRDWRPDVIHLHSSFAGAVVRLAYLLGRRRPKVIYCAHGWSFSIEGSRWRQRAYATAERMLARVTDATVVISGSEQEAGCRAGLRSDKFSLVLSGIAAAPMLPVPSREREPLNLVFVGRHDRQKGLDVLLAALPLLRRPVVLHVIGEGVLGRSLARTLPGVIFHGWQPRAAIDRFLIQADAVIMPSRWEGFGLVAIEAMRAGRAVIASDAGALPEIVRDGVTGRIVPVDNAAALAGAIDALDRPALRRMGAAGRRAFLERFTASRMNAAILEVYASAMVPKPLRKAA